MRDRYERGKGGAANSSYGTMVRDVLYGALVAAVCTALSFILALAGSGRLYYVAVFLPFFMLACLLVAWFLYLKDDGFIRSAKKSGPAATEGPVATDLSLYAPRGDELVPRRSDDLYGPQKASGPGKLGDIRSGESGPGGRSGTAGARRALLWAAVQLGLLAMALYSWAGVGAGYFIPVAR
ncbi:MAG: hypothetical protein ABIJ86_17335 [Spirochaetota bacterium]